MFPHSFNISGGGGGAGLEEMLHHHEHKMEQQRWRWKPSVEVAPNCPRCASTNTKFCYYNNYSLSQPRYFCKACRRYWTKGGSLRNVPVGGGCRKNRRSKSSSSRNHPFGCVSQDSSISLPADDDSQNDTNNASRDIDMALVFAKFLNPKPTTAEDNNNNNNNNNNVSSSTTSNNYLETENDDAVVVQSVNKNSGSSNPVVVVESENFGEIDELERLLGVCDDEDGLWSYSWEPLPFSMPPPLSDDSDDAQFLPMASASAFTDSCWTNCTSFDLSTMELFSSAPS